MITIQMHTQVQQKFVEMAPMMTVKTETFNVRVVPTVLLVIIAHQQLLMMVHVFIRRPIITMVIMTVTE